MLHDRQLVVDKGIGPARYDLEYARSLILESFDLGLGEHLRGNQVAGSAQFYCQDSAGSV